MTTRQASLPDGFSEIRLMMVTTVFARTWSDSEVSFGSRGCAPRGSGSRLGQSQRGIKGRII